MLIEFSVENYRSIKNRISLSCVADTLPKDDKEVGKPIEVAAFDFSVVPVIGIFGPNASGKTTVLKAMADGLNLIGGHKRAKSNLRPFELDEKSKLSPSRFDLKIYAGNAIYEYSIALDRDLVWEEHLSYRPASTRSLRLLFSRQYNSETKKHEWKNGEDFKGPHTQLQDGLNVDTPWIGFLANSLDVPVVRPLIHWTRNRIKNVFSAFDSGFERVVCQLVEDHPSLKEIVKQVLRGFDSRIGDFEFERKSSSKSSLGSFDVWIIPEGRKERAGWKLSDESHGNKRLFHLSLAMAFALVFGGPFMVDEINSGFHPAISERLIRFFHDPSINVGNAQLFFASHDSRHLSRDLIRRDEVWFTSREEDLSTSLFPLTDFEVRGDLSIPRAYLDGRLGTAPRLSELEEWRQLRGKFEG